MRISELLNPGMQICVNHSIVIIFEQDKEITKNRFFTFSYFTFILSSATLLLFHLCIYYISKVAPYINKFWIQFFLGRFTFHLMLFKLELREQWSWEHLPYDPTWHTCFQNSHVVSNFVISNIQIKRIFHWKSVEETWVWLSVENVYLGQRMQMHLILDLWPLIKQLKRHKI